MFGDDSELQELRKKWETMSYGDKVDKFLWKMVWFHHRKHVPGNPNQAINSLTETIDRASESSENLTRSIKIATWVAGIAASLGVILGSVSLIGDINGKVEVKQKVFDECFDYYANIEQEVGIDNNLVKLCMDKANNWTLQN